MFEAALQHITKCLKNIFSCSKKTFSVFKKQAKNTFKK